MTASAAGTRVATPEHVTSQSAIGEPEYRQHIPTLARHRPKRLRAISSAASRLVPPIALTGLLLAAWQFYSTRPSTDQSVIPSPTQVISAGWHDRINLWNNVVPTLHETLLGFALSITVAWFFAIACDLSGIFRRAVEPLLVVSQTIPLVAIAPLFIIWFGFTTLPKVLIVALVTFFPLTVSLIRGFSATPSEMTNLLKSMGANSYQRFLRLRVPTSLPFFFSGLRISITYAVIGAVFAEYVGAEKGLGIYMLVAKNSMRTDLVLAAVMVTSIVSLILYFLVSVVERLALPWESPNKVSRRRQSRPKSANAT